jgi:hypothetical protein
MDVKLTALDLYAKVRGESIYQGPSKDLKEE